MAYLRRIAIHECFRKRKKNSHQQAYILQSDEQAEDYAELDTDFLPEEHLQNKENRAQLLLIIQSLPKKQWEMIYLYYYAEFTTEEIARLNNCSTSNVRKTLRTARSTIKSKLEKDKKKLTGGMAVMPLGALLFMEEQAFAASYVSAAGANIAGTTGTATKSINVYAIAAGIVAVGVAATALYLALRPAEAEPYKPYEPAYEIYMPVLEHTKPTEPMPPIEEELEEPTEQNRVKCEYAFPEAQLPIEQETQPHPPEELPTPEPPTTQEPYEPMPEVKEEEPENEPYESKPYEPMPTLIDRTPEILTALTGANAAEDVAMIVSYYGFTIFAEIERSLGMRHRFYVTNEGSGDILIGIAAYENGTSWSMRFEHFTDGHAPADILDLLGFMTQ